MPLYDLEGTLKPQIWDSPLYEYRPVRKGDPRQWMPTYSGTVKITRVYDDLANAIAQTLIHDEIWETFAKQTERQENQFKPVLVSLFNQQENSVLNAVFSTPLPKPRGIFQNPVPAVITPLGTYRSAKSDKYAEKVFKPADWELRFQIAERPFVENSIESAALDALREVAPLTDASVIVQFNVKNPTIQRLVQEKVEKFSFEVNDTTLKALKREFAHGIELGESVPQIAKRVGKVFDIAKKSRTNLIARTEIIGTTNRGTLEGYKQSGVVKGKTWITSRDGLVRDIHAAMEGETVPLDETFSNGLEHPGDWGGPIAQIANCRCAMTGQVI